jgi:hypothetical protein
LRGIEDAVGYGEFLTAWQRTYERTRRPIEVSFRSLVHLPHYPDRATHLIHPYPAKLLAHIPYIFIRGNVLGRRPSSVLDPFSGSGTVLLEAALAGAKVSGADPNPLSRLIARVKVTPINLEKIQDALESVSQAALLLGMRYWLPLLRVLVASVALIHVWVCLYGFDTQSIPRDIRSDCSCTIIRRKWRLPIR